MTPRRTAEERIAEDPQRRQPNDYGVGARAIWIASAGISGIVDRLLSGSGLPLVLSRGHGELPRPLPPLRTAGVDGLCSLMGHGREALPRVDAFVEIDHHSDEWDNAPMPYSIFFTQTGNAVHGTYEQRSLGHAVSHGCVRLSLANAATLWGLVKRQKMAKTTVVVTGDIPGAKPQPEAIAAPKTANASAPFPRFPAPPDLFSLFR
jgi:L,D-transpeptidase catalytic domain